MNKNVLNEDYKKGITYILKESRKVGLDIKQYSWVIGFSLYLSEQNLCEKFWRNVVANNTIKKIPNCKVINNLFHGDTHLFEWFKTPQGSIFWYDFEVDMKKSFHGDTYLEIFNKIKKI